MLYGFSNWRRVKITSQRNLKAKTGKGQFDSVMSLSLKERGGVGGEGGSLWLLEEMEVGCFGLHSICCNSCTDHPRNM